MTKDNKFGNEGFTLVEVIVVIAILGILAGIAVPNLLGIKEKAKEKVCNANCLQLERMYEAHLFMKEIKHSESVFNKYLQEYGEDICPDHGNISYVNGKIQCSVHMEDDDVESDDKDDGSVPFL